MKNSVYGRRISLVSVVANRGNWNWKRVENERSKGLSEKNPLYRLFGVSGGGFFVFLRLLQLLSQIAFTITAKRRLRAVDTQHFTDKLFIKLVVGHNYQAAEALQQQAADQ